MSRTEHTITRRSNLHAPHSAAGWRHRGKRGSSTPLPSTRPRGHSLELVSGIRARVASSHDITASSGSGQSGVISGSARRPAPRAARRDSGASRAHVVHRAPDHVETAHEAPRPANDVTPGRPSTSAFTLAVGSLFGLVLGGTLAGVALGVAGASWAVATVMVATSALLALLVATRQRLGHSTVTSPPFAPAETR